MREDFIVGLLMALAIGIVFSPFILIGVLLALYLGG